MIDTQDRLDFKYPYDLPASNLPILFSQQKLLVKNFFSWISINSKFENQRSKKLLNWEKSLKQIKRKLKGWNKIENSSQWRHESYLTKTYCIYEVIIYPWLHGKVDFWTEASQMVLEPIKFWHFHFINII